MLESSNNHVNTNKEELRTNFTYEILSTDDQVTQYSLYYFQSLISESSWVSSSIGSFLNSALLSVLLRNL